MFWEVTPYHTKDADSCVLPAQTEDNHRAALEYAKDRLEELWDQLSPGESASVTIEFCSGDMPEVNDDL